MLQQPQSQAGCIDDALNGNCCAVQVVKGADVVLSIERTKTDRDDKPFEDIKIVNVENMARIE